MDLAGADRPDVVEFYTREWDEIGTKLPMVDHIPDITGINRSVLSGLNVSTFPVAERMTWATNRETRRAGDRAYSLLGIFGVNMPLIYGEGERAFQRPQEATLSITEDYTILAYFLDRDRTHSLGDRQADSVEDIVAAILDRQGLPSQECGVNNAVERG
ncbi:hypothetical protein QBC47DRAFT_427451 [Echria macrotheca]|uniref:Uncharacterized protein n=1 Tax=Echria macrotheca TaxID=438768 RepID=A0AAJ0BLC3_9PEZI|nr:hypothetical protein QBC47DRAFT_427451 [Echria macrotheca]